MSEITGAAIGALAVICIPLAAWFSRRATPEGRRTLRVERLGSVYVLMPESKEKDDFKRHLTDAIGSLNAWLDPNARKRRRVVQGAAVSLYVGGVAVAILIINSLDDDVKPWMSPLLGVCLGAAIAGVAQLSALLVDRNVRDTAEKATKAAEAAAAAVRIEALRLGVPVSDKAFEG